MAERQFGPYRLVRQIAVGGMAEIHLAKTKGIAGFEKYVALKMIHPNLAEDEQFIQMLVDEAKIAVQLTHANIAQTFDLGRVGDTYYITMEYVDGSDLYKILRRASEIDIEMPLDVCTFIAKEVASALDHAHRKRDHSGKSLGIVHRDVSPQNALVSYAGEVKLVDFGIAKATSKVKQTAVGVIKGKYYYMSPEQAWGDPIDHRSDIFSAGIVLYEMMTGQMLYLEEDLHRLLDMVRKADIAPPTRLRKDIPPQLERIVMHALAKVPGERYQSAGDFATDLERFLHSYSPTFTASKVAGVLRRVIGEPKGVPDQDPEIEVRDGALSTHELNAEDLAHAGDELRDENSMIFDMEELRRASERQPAPAAKHPSGPQRTVPKQPTPVAPAPVVKPAAQIPSIARPRSPSVAPSRSPGIAPSRSPDIAPSRSPGIAPSRSPARPRSLTKPRDLNEETREMSAPPPRPGEEGDSGLLPMPAMRRPVAEWDASETHPGGDGDEGLGEHTMITTPDFLAAAGGSSDLDEGGDATMITQMPRGEQTTDQEYSPDDEADTQGGSDDEGPTIQRDFTQQPARRGGAKKGPAPAAFAAKIHAPTVSALRTPKPSRRTPPGGAPVQGNVLQALVQSQPSEAMPNPGRHHGMAPLQAPVQPQQPEGYPPGYPQNQGYPADPNLPFGLPTPPPGMPMQHTPGVAPHLQPYTNMQGYPDQSGAMPQQNPQQYQQYPPQYPPQYQQPQMNPGSLYQLQPYGAPPPQPMSLTGQLRLFEADEIPQAYKLDGKTRWVGLIIAGIVAVSVAAGVTFFIIRATRDSGPSVATIKIESSPAGADVSFDDTRMSGKTPMAIENVPIGTHHDIKVELALYKTYTEAVDIPRTGGTVPIMALLKKITGKIVINSKPSGAEIRVNGELRGRTPTTINDVDMSSAKTIDVRLKDYQPITQDLKWPANGQIDLDLKLDK